MDISEKNKKIPFPQANDFNKIIKIVLIDNPDNLSNKSLTKIPSTHSKYF